MSESVFKRNRKYEKDARGVPLPQGGTEVRRRASKKRNAASALVVSFDERKRRGFLTGFRRRKEARRQRAFLQSVDEERRARIEARRDARRDQVGTMLRCGAVTMIGHIFFC